MAGNGNNLYVDLGTLRQYLAINGTDESRDALLTSALTAASRYIDRITNRRFYRDSSPTARVYRTRGRVLHDLDGDGLLVDDIAELDGLTVDLGGSGAWSPYTGWTADSVEDGQPITMLRGSWTGATVQVTATFGWPAPPDEVVQATLIQAARLWKRKDSPEGVMASAEWGAVRVSRVDPDVQALTGHLILHAIV